MVALIRKPIAGVVTAAVAARFSGKVDRSAGPDGCWPWTSSVMTQGRGSLWVAGCRRLSAPRVAYFLATGADPAEQDVLHRCDNAACVNPAHLFLGSHTDNMADMVGKGRGTQGERSALAKLSECDVHHIRARRRQGEACARLAAAYAVAPSHVSGICSGKVWGHVSLDPIESCPACGASLLQRAA